MGDNIEVNNFFTFSATDYPQCATSSILFSGFGSLLVLVKIILYTVYKIKKIRARKIEKKRRETVLSQRSRGMTNQGLTNKVFDIEEEYMTPNYVRKTLRETGCVYSLFIYVCAIWRNSKLLSEFHHISLILSLVCSFIWIRDSIYTESSDAESTYSLDSSDLEEANRKNAVLAEIYDAYRRGRGLTM